MIWKEVGTRINKQRSPEDVLPEYRGSKNIDLAKWHFSLPEARS